jgi:hypothetical protein
MGASYIRHYPHVEFAILVIFYKSGINFLHSCSKGSLIRLQKQCDYTIRSTSTPNSRSYITQFSQPDSIIPDPYNSQDWNRYAYARNNPLKYTDPNGHDPILFALLLGAILLSACAPAPTPTQVSASEGLTPRQAEIQALIDEGPGSYQAAIDKAVELYGIDTHGVDPTFDPNLGSYGNTKWDSNGTIGENGLVTGGSVATTIGPEAFASPPDLVDAIAHEAVHVEQFQNGRWYERIDLDGDGFADIEDGYNLNEVEAYDRSLERKNELELSDAVIQYDTDIRNNEYYNYLPDWLQERVNQGNYTLP